MSMGGRDELSCYYYVKGGTKKYMKVPTGTGTTILSTDFNSKERTREKEEQILSKKTVIKSKNSTSEIY